MSEADHLETPDGPEARAGGSTREDFLKRAAALGVAVGAPSVLAACGSSGGSSSTSSAQTSGTPAAGTQKIRQGGNMRIGLASGSTSDSTDPHTSTSTGDA